MQYAEFIVHSRDTNGIIVIIASAVHILGAFNSLKNEEGRFG
jgi:hypothetical protein